MSTLKVTNLQKLDGTTFPVGKVGQTIYSSTSTDESSTSATYANLTFTASITPTSTSSKVLIVYSGFANIYARSNNTDYGMAKLVRGGSTDLVQFADQLGYYGNTTAESNNIMSVSYLDSPSTTSATTFGIAIRVNSNGQCAFKVRDQQITLMEVLAWHQY